MRRLMLVLTLLCTASVSVDAFQGDQSALLSGQRSELVPGTPDGFGYPEYPFINLVKTTPQEWVYGNNSVYPGFSPPNEIDANGYPLYTSANHGGWVTAPLFVPQQYARPGNYVISWTGAGELKIAERPTGGAGSFASAGCTGQDLSRGGAGGCSNMGCTTFQGYISGTTLTVTSPPRWNGRGNGNCNLVVGQPISGSGIEVTKFGTPTIITARGTGAGGTGTYTLNFSQTVGNSTRPVTFHPGGRLELSVSGEKYTGLAGGWNLAILQTGTALDQTNTVQSLALYYSCLNIHSCSGADDEKVYWTGQIAGTKFLSTLAGMKAGVLRDLGWSNTNFGNQTTWSTRKPASYFSWDSTYLTNRLYAGITRATKQTGSVFTASIGGNILTVTSISSGSIAVGYYLDGNPGVAANTVIGAMSGYLSSCPTCTGTGGTGTYLLTGSQTVGSESMSVTIYKNSVDFLDRPPQDKDTVTVIWGASSPNPSTNMFSADGGTTYQLVLNAGGTVVMNNNVPIINGTSAYLSTMVYDADFGKWLQFGGVLGSGVNGINDPVPPEVFVEICNEVGQAEGAIVSPWFVLPPMASDPLTDWTIQEALYVKNNFPSMVPEFETINEIWNKLTSAAGYAFSKMVAHGLADAQVLTTSGPTALNSNVLQFDAVPSYVKVGTSIVDITTAGINVGVTVAAINRSSAPQTVTILQGAVNSGVGTGDRIAFSWAAAVNGSAFGGAWSPEEAGKIASTMCQAVSAVYGGDTTRYKCMTGLNTNGEGPAVHNANARLLSSAYIGQNPANIPIQSGCAGATAIQTDCPTPFLQTASRNHLTHVDVVNYWGIAECACNGGLPASVETVQKEVSDAYNYFYGAPSAQASIMSSYVATWANPNSQDTIAYFDQYVYAPVHAWATGYGLQGLLFYEGSYSVCLLAPAGRQGSCPEAGGDKTVPVSRATSSGSTCLLATTITVNGYINDGRNAGGRVPGNIFAPSSTVYLSPYSTLIRGAVGAPTVLGFANHTDYSEGYVLDGPAQYVDTTSMTFAANGAVAGMTVTIRSATGGAWSTVVGNSYTVQATGLSQSQIPIDLDCSGLGTLSSMTLSYTGSYDYINYLRNNSWSAPDVETATYQMCIVAAKYGGGGCSQLDIAGPVSPGTVWQLTSPDLYGYNPVASCTACTVSGTTLTLGGTVSGRYQAGQTIVGTGIGTAPAITITGVLSGTGTAPGDTLSLSSSPGNLSARAIYGTNVGLFPAWNGFLDYNSTHGGFLLKRDIDPAANDNIPMFLNQAA